MATWIVAALDSELDRLKAELHAQPFREIPGCSCYRGRMGRARVYLAAVGIGVVSAAFGLASISAAVVTHRVVMTGTAGALQQSGLNVGDLAVASSETLSELGLCIGAGIGNALSLGLPGLPQEIPFDAGIAGRLLEAAARHTNATLGKFLSVVGVSEDEAQAEARAHRFGTLVENMEGYALALAGQRLNIEVAEIRGVSNVAGVRDKSAWNLSLANDRAQAAVLTFLENII